MKAKEEVEDLGKVSLKLLSGSLPWSPSPVVYGCNWQSAGRRSQVSGAEISPWAGG